MDGVCETYTKNRIVYRETFLQNVRGNKARKPKRIGVGEKAENFISRLIVYRTKGEDGFPRFMSFGQKSDGTCLLNELTDGNPNEAVDSVEESAILLPAEVCAVLAETQRNCSGCQNQPNH